MGKKRAALARHPDPVGRLANTPRLPHANAISFLAHPARTRYRNAPKKHPPPPWARTAGPPNRWPAYPARAAAIRWLPWIQHSPAPLWKTIMLLRRHGLDWSRCGAFKRGRGCRGNQHRLREPRILIGTFGRDGCRRPGGRITQRIQAAADVAGRFHITGHHRAAGTTESRRAHR